MPKQKAQPKKSTRLQDFISHKDAVRACQRLRLLETPEGPSVSHWETLKRLIEISQANINDLTEGQRGTLREDLAAAAYFTALRDEPRLYLPQPQLSFPLPDWENVSAVMTEIRNSLECWVERGTLMLGPFHIKVLIERMPPAEPIRQRRSKPGVGPGVYHISREIMTSIDAESDNELDYPSLISRHYHQLFDQSVLYVLAVVLRELAPAVVRCKQCSRIFLRPRRDAQFCSHRCSSVSSMRAKRHKEKELKERRSRGRQAVEERG